jgi:LPXTG-site transpeptidase (sortase) family protein
LGAAKLPSTNFPWQKGDINTYIACHRLGFPGTESYNQCLNLPFIQKGDEVLLEDTKGRVYRYRVSEVLTVSPYDTWVTRPVAGRQMVSLQTCVETPGDFSTLGPNWAARFIAAPTGLARDPSPSRGSSGFLFVALLLPFRYPHGVYRKLVTAPASVCSPPSPFPAGAGVLLDTRGRDDPLIVAFDRSLFREAQRGPYSRDLGYEAARAARMREPQEP